MKKIISFFIILIAVTLLPLTTYAHPGNTNNDGGHYDHSDGEYHYHHGYPAHSHYDVDSDGYIDCPYNFVDQTSHSNDTSSGENSNFTRIITVYEDREVIKEVSIIPAWCKWILGISAFAIFILLILNHTKKNDIVRLEKQVEQHKEKGEKAAIDNQLLFEENQQLQNDLTSVISAIDVGTPYFPKNVQVDLSLYKIDIPDDVYITEDNIPIKGTATEDSPYGEYTAFISKKSDIYHMKRNCGSAYNLLPLHLFEILDKRRPCRQCVRTPYTELPKWYTQLMQLCNKLYRNP